MKMFLRIRGTLIACTVTGSTCALCSACLCVLDVYPLQLARVCLLSQGLFYVCCVCVCAGCVSAPARARVLVSESVLCCGGV